MKMFKSIDEKLAYIGFVKQEENQFGARYHRDNSPFGEQIVCLLHKKSGEHILQSYDPNLFDNKNIGCSNVGLTYTELKLFLKKMKRLGLKSRKRCKMDSNEKCFNCKHLTYREGYEYPFTCAKHKWVSSKHSEVQQCFENKCTKFERKEAEP